MQRYARAVQYRGSVISDCSVLFCLFAECSADASAYTLVLARERASECAQIALNGVPDKFTDNFAFRYTLLNPSLCFAINVVSRDNVMTFRFPRNWKLLPHERAGLNGLSDCNLNTLCNVNYSTVDWHAYRFSHRLVRRSETRDPAVQKSHHASVIVVVIMTVIVVMAAFVTQDEIIRRRRVRKEMNVFDRSTFADSVAYSLDQDFKLICRARRQIFTKGRNDEAREGNKVRKRSKKRGGKCRFAGVEKSEI